jgi:nucleoside-diphosphate-sugar epimerase
LLNGVSGNIGIDVFQELLSKQNNINLRLFVRGSKKNKKLFKPYKEQIEIIWGGILDYKAAKRAVQNQDIIIHMAGIIPPECYKDNEYTYKVNVIGTKNILKASKELKKPPKIIYTSSIVVYGDRLENQLIKVDDRPSPNDIYGLTKLHAESLIRKSGLEYVILRLSYCVSTRILKMTPLLFLMPLETKVEIIHTKDVAIAIANAITHKEVWNRTFLLGGGEECRIVFRTHANDLFEILGFGRDFLPEDAFEKDGFNCGYYENTEAQNLLKFQHHNLEDFYEEVREWIGFKRHFVPLVKWFVKKYLLRRLKKSKFLMKEERRKAFEKYKESIDFKESLEEKLVLKTKEE